ncbi:aKG-HExxH-type peptide beta-hydroxylase [Streptomyces olivaceus]|uniref:aKG-HExxH-type peptide beta-hydroxylase n=1 Tax=Streptomyces olivaceus TaxID=47716 RepID=UPI00188574B8|nr:HEXXH motif-containing putative peptide modification protein [Streptomyces olivaceus]
MFPVVSDRALLELARTEGGPDTLALLTRDQDTRRLLLLRAVLDAAEAADPSVCAPGQKARLRADWALLTEADRAAAVGARTAERRPGDLDPAGGRAAAPSGAQIRRVDRYGAPCPPAVAVPTTAPAAAPTPGNPVRARLFHPLTGPWARSCLRGLDAPQGQASGERARRLRRDLAHFGAVAAVGAAASGVPFTTRLTARAGILVLPSLGALHTVRPGDVPVDVTCTAGRLVLRQTDAPDVTVHLESGYGAWSGALAWTPAHALPPLVPGAPHLPFDDLDPYREPPGDSRHGNLRTPLALDDAEYKRWLQVWSGMPGALRSGGAQRLAEAATLLRCLIPLRTPSTAGAGRGSGSATRREAFGALLSSTPPDAPALAATLVHELQHAKLTALSDLVTLHRAGPEARYFAPWRPDPRPYDGLLQGTYAHLALAAHFQRRALRTASCDRDRAWAQHARYRAQVQAALPALVGSPDLTVRGRRFVDEMTACHERMAEPSAPRGHTARAQAYVQSARALWTRRHASALPPPNE